MNKPRITQAKHGKHNPDGAKRFLTRNWMLDCGEMLLVYESFETAVLGLLTINAKGLVSPAGLRNFQWVSAP